MKIFGIPISNGIIRFRLNFGKLKIRFFLLDFKRRAVKCISPRLEPDTAVVSSRE